MSQYSALDTYTLLLQHHLHLLLQQLRLPLFFLPHRRQHSRRHVHLL